MQEACNNVVYNKHFRSFAIQISIAYSFSHNNRDKAGPLSLTSFLGASPIVCAQIHLGVEGGAGRREMAKQDTGMESGLGAEAGLNTEVEAQEEEQPIATNTERGG